MLNIVIQVTADIFYIKQHHNLSQVSKLLNFI